MFLTFADRKSLTGAGCSCGELARRSDRHDPVEQQRTQRANTIRQRQLRIRQGLCQTVDVGRSLRRNDPELRQVTPQSVDRLRALAHQKIARAEQHPAGLLLRRLHGHEAHGGTLCSLADRLRVRRVVLLPLHERLHVDRRDQLHIMTEF